MDHQQIILDFGAWLEDAFEYPYSPLTRKSYLRVARELLEGGLPAEGLQALSVEQIRRFTERTQEGRRYAVASRIVRTAAIKLLWRFLLERGLVAYDAMPGLAQAKEAERRLAGRGGRKPKRKPAVLGWADQDALLQTVAKNPAEDIRVRDRALLALLLVTGLRRQECCELKISGLNLAEGRLRILGKGNKERVILFEPTACGLPEAIKDWEHWRQRFVEKAAQAGREDPGTLFLTRSGRPVRANLLYQQVSRYLRAAGLAPGHFGPHVLRHTAASRMLAQNVPLRRVMENMGHEHLATLEIYAHLLDSEARTRPA